MDKLFIQCTLKIRDCFYEARGQFVANTKLTRLNTQKRVKLNANQVCRMRLHWLGKVINAYYGLFGEALNRQIPITFKLIR